VRDLLNFSCVKPIKTVHAVLEKHGALNLLRDDLISVATQEIYSEARSRREIQREIKAKERAIEMLASKYAREGLSQEQVRQCIYSVGDNHAFLRVNRDPCERMIGYLKHYFHPTQTGKDDLGSLAIRSGRGGARLSHDHAKQYAYVLQSLTLWREILHGMSLVSNSQLRETLHAYPGPQTCFIYGRWLNRIYCPRRRGTGSWILARA
jgi:hypothetical protein